MAREHNYKLTLTWTGNKGSGTSNYTAYARDHLIAIEGKPIMSGSSDAAFRGDPMKHTPEDMFLASISACHMLWYLHLCAEAGVVVTGYIDNADGLMIQHANGSGQFSKVTLRPLVTVSHVSMIQPATNLHKDANEFCFIARSCNFPIHHEGSVITE